MARTLFILAVLLSATAPARAAEAPAATTPALQQYYQAALEFYTAGDYRRAIMKWNEILKEDPDQRTADTMILEARRQIVILTRKKRRETLEMIRTGYYQKALLALEVLLDQDPGDPQITSLRTRLEKVIKITPVIAASDKGSRMALRGLEGYLAMTENAQLAFNGLRYAVELKPKDADFKALLDMLLVEHPSLASDAVTPGMTLMEYKHFVALHHIYDAKYHLAVGVLNEILALEPADLTALKRLGSAYYSLGHMDKAEDAWTKALELAPNDRGLKSFLAKVRNK